MPEFDYVPDELDRRLVVATQAGLPLVPRPYDTLAAQLGVSATDVKERLGVLLAQGVIRRIGAVPNHYALGYAANGMSVWNVDDALDFVTHCYRRPRHVPAWPYNLFAMVHGRSRDEVDEKIASIARLLGDACAGHDVLFSTRILKKTGLRISG